MGDVFTDVGESIAADLFDGTINAPADWFVAWGTGGATAAAKGDTALVTEAAEARVAATESQPAADQNELVATITSASSQTIDEMGVFDASTGGNMPIRSTFAGIALETDDAIEFTVTITWS